MTTFRLRFLIGTSVVSVLALQAGLSSTPGTLWEVGDVFVAMAPVVDERNGKILNPATAGRYIVYGQDGSPRGDSFLAVDPKAGIPTGCAIDVRDGTFWGTTFYDNKVVHVSDLPGHAAIGSPINTLTEIGPGTVDAFGDLVQSATESVTFDAAGNIYVGTLDGNISPARIIKYDPHGVKVASWDVPKGDRGADWIDVDRAGRYAYYTSEDNRIRRLDLASGATATFATTPGTRAYGLRLLPPGDGTGGVLVAGDTGVHRLSATGAPLTTYSYTDPTDRARDDGDFFALNLSPDGESFWTASFATGRLYKFHIGSRALLGGPVDAGNGRYTVSGLCVKLEYTAAQNVCYQLDPDGKPVLDGMGQPMLEEDGCRAVEVCRLGGPDSDGDGYDADRDPDCVPPGTAEKCLNLQDDDRDGLVDETCARATVEDTEVSWLLGGAAAIAPPGFEYTYSLAVAPPLPGGPLDVDPSTGTVTGHVGRDTAGTYRVTATVTRKRLSDGALDRADGQFWWTIVDRTPPPVDNQAPDCIAGTPSVPEIWPPDHRLVSVSIGGIIDPDGDAVHVAIAGIQQDEPTNTRGDGNTVQDGFLSPVSSSAVLLRAERAGEPKQPGDGRIYEVLFTASDGRGGSCSGSVRVGVPRDRGKQSQPPVDSGVRYDSLTGARIR